MLITLAQILLKLVTLGQRSRSKWQKMFLKMMKKIAKNSTINIFENKPYSLIEHFIAVILIPNMSIYIKSIYCLFTYNAILDENVSILLRNTSKYLQLKKWKKCFWIKKFWWGANLHVTEVSDWHILMSLNDSALTDCAIGAR